MSIGNFEYCQLCKCPVDYWRGHIKSQTHKENTKRYLLNKKQAVNNG